MEIKVEPRGFEPLPPAPASHACALLAYQLLNTKSGNKIILKKNFFIN